VNALGQRVKKTTGAAETYFAYDEAGHLVGEYDATGAAIEETVWLGDTPVAVVRPAAGGGSEVFFVWTDQLDTPRVISDDQNRIRWEWDGNDPFGNNAPNEDPSGLGAFTYNLRFPGQYHDAETGLSYNYFRDYDPSIGRYIQSDPIGLSGGMSTYGYVNGNSLLYVDAYGLVWLPDAPDWLVNAAAGFGDDLSFGGTRVIRRWMGNEYTVNECSTAYEGGKWGAVGLSLAFGGAHLARNAIYQMAKGNALKGLSRLALDRRTWGSVRDTWSKAAGGGQRWLASNGQSLHHWLIPQRWAEVNAAFNYMPISAGLNTWMNGSTGLRTAGEWAFRATVSGIYGAGPTAAANSSNCTCTN
jgi:RHS repeat-associated protein